MDKIQTKTIVTKDFQTVIGRTAYISGDYVYITDFDYDENLPITHGCRPRIIIKNDFAWMKKHPNDLFEESLDLGLLHKIRNLKQFQEFTTKECA